MTPVHAPLERDPATAAHQVLFRCHKGSPREASGCTLYEETLSAFIREFIWESVSPALLDRCFSVIWPVGIQCFKTIVALQGAVVTQQGSSKMLPSIVLQTISVFI